MQHILVVRGGALGDGLLTLPALAALRTRWPLARITLVGPRNVLPFARAAGLADRAVPIEDEAGLTLMAANAEPPAWAAADLAVVWLQRWRAVAQRLAHWGAAQVLAGPSLPAADERVHVADHLFRVLATGDIGRSCLARPLPVPDQALPAARQWWLDHPLPANVPVIALHPGSGGRHKCWPQERYLALARRLTGAGQAVLVCLGPAESTSLRPWRDLGQVQADCRIAYDLDLPTLAGLLGRCAGFIGNDAGVTHLAAALGLPTIAIFGPTDPDRWAPRGRSVRVLRDPGGENGGSVPGSSHWHLQAGDVQQASDELLATGSCRHCPGTALERL
jgi:heptosyltransferase III